jgi:hypothetical protein
MTGAAEDPVVAALQAALAGEHAAVYAYSVIGGRLAGDSPQAGRAIDAYRAHRGLRDGLAGALQARGKSPVPTEPGYALPRPVEDAASAAYVARLVEDRCSVLHAALVATASGEERRLGVEALVGCATRGVLWQAEPTAFPGVSSRASD